MQHVADHALAEPFGHVLEYENRATGSRSSNECTVARWLDDGLPVRCCEINIAFGHVTVPWASVTAGRVAEHLYA